MKSTFLVLTMILMTAQSAHAVRCAPFLARIFGFDKKAVDYSISLERILGDVPYGIKSSPHRDNTIIEIIDLSTDATFAKTIVAEGIVNHVELTLLNGKLALITARNIGKLESIIQVWDVVAGETLISNLEIPAPISGLQAFSAHDGLDLAAAISATTKTAYVFDMDSGAMGHTQIKNELFPGHTQLFPDSLEMSTGKLKTLENGRQTVETRKLEIAISRKDGDLIFTLHENKQPEVILGFAPADLLNIQKD